MARRNSFADTISTAISTWFGFGYAPAAPGTAGAAAAIGIAVLIEHYTGAQPAWFAGLALAVSGPGIWAAGETARQRAIEGSGVRGGG